MDKLKELNDKSLEKVSGGTYDEADKKEIDPVKLAEAIDGYDELEIFDLLSGAPNRIKSFDDILDAVWKQKDYLKAATLLVNDTKYDKAAINYLVGQLGESILK